MAKREIIIDDTLEKVGDERFADYICHALCHQGHCTFSHAGRAFTLAAGDCMIVARRGAAILVALVVARTLSSALNYLCNKTLVFRSEGAVAKSMARYFGLVVAIASLSYLGTTSLAWMFDCTGIWITCAKMAFELLLFLLAYHVQSKWVFGRNPA